jgi:hypothetical protein
MRERVARYEMCICPNGKIFFVERSRNAAGDHQSKSSDKSFDCEILRFAQDDKVQRVRGGYVGCGKVTGLFAPQTGSLSAYSLKRSASCAR